MVDAPTGSAPAGSNVSDPVSLPTVTADVDELRAAVVKLQGEALEARDTRIGLEAQLSQLHEKLAAFEGTPLDEAERVLDEAAAYSEYVAEEMTEFQEAQRAEIARLKASTTWRIGRAFVGPPAWVVARVRRR